MDPCSRVDPDCFPPINVYLWKKKHGLECFLLLLIFFSFEDPKCFSNCYRIISNESRSRTAPSSKGKNPAWE